MARLDYDRLRPLSYPQTVKLDLEILLAKQRFLSGRFSDLFLVGQSSFVRECSRQSKDRLRSSDAIVL